MSTQPVDAPARAPVPASSKPRLGGAAATAGRGSGRRGPTLALGTREISLPSSKPARIAIGSALVLGGVLGFLPILGFWMIPLGLIVLGQDVPVIRRWHRRAAVRFGRWRRARAARRAAAPPH